MVSEKIIQVHTHRVVAGAECNPERPCSPMNQALKKGWLLAANALQIHPDRGPERFVCVGDIELGYLSVFRYCPFCAVDMEATFPNYAPFHEGQPTVMEHRKGTL